MDNVQTNDEQYSLLKIVSIWVAVAIPMPVHMTVGPERIGPRNIQRPLIVGKAKIESQARSGICGFGFAATVGNDSVRDKVSGKGHCVVC